MNDSRMWEQMSDKYFMRCKNITNSIETVLCYPFREFLRNSKGYFKDCVADETGAIAVETAILTPFVLLGMLMAGNLGLSVYNHQKIFTAAYSGASFLHDKVAAGDLSGLKSTKNDNGEIEIGEWLSTAKLVIKDASGLPLDLSKIDIEAYCACPAMNPGDLQNPDDADEMTGRQSFYDREQIEVSESSEICPTTCKNGNKSRIIAEIIIDYDAKAITGGKDSIRETLVTRLR